MSRIGMPELIVILLAVIILFGPKALPDIARGIGQAIRNFKKALEEPDAGNEKKEDTSSKSSTPDA
ncbi:MAG: twin-arginine translocase TatA/TatE family subunit [Candidatus Omnitrophica bacterium]|nr:twin-arginine translocase TatA/TatE family subunit [Candidatus Omnitrophota bacterium]